MNSTTHSLLLILIAAAVTIGLRAFPFLLFGKGRKMPRQLRLASEVMPPAIIAVLVIYCVRSDLFLLSREAAATFIAVLGVVGVHLWKRNTLLSIAVGTILYMILIRVL